MKISFDPEYLHKRFKDELKSRQDARKRPANFVRLGVLLDNARVTASLVNELPQLQSAQEALEVEFVPSSSGRDIYMRVDLRNAAGFLEVLKDEEDVFGDVLAYGEKMLYNVVRTKIGLYDKFPLYRLLIALHLEVDLDKLEIHHINLNQHDHSIENLLVTDKSTHTKAHALIDADLEVLKTSKPDIYSSFTNKPSLESLQKSFPTLHLVLTFKAPSLQYLSRGENTDQHKQRGPTTLGELLAMPAYLDLRDGTNLRRFEAPDGYASNMALILQALDELTPLRQFKTPENGGWVKKKEIMRIVQAKKVGQTFSISTLERWLSALITCRMIEKGSSEKTGKANGFYRLTGDAYIFPRA